MYNIELLDKKSIIEKRDVMTFQMTCLIAIV